MSTTELATLDAMLDARLRALELRATGQVSFAGTGEDLELEQLFQLVEHARGEDDEPTSFDGGSPSRDGDAPPRDPASSEGLIARAARELSALMGQVLRDASQQAVVATGMGPRLHTRVGWMGDAVTHVGPGVSTAETSAHAAEVAAALAASTRRLRLVTMVMAAAAKIAAIIATPGAAVASLPIAYRCVRDVYEAWGGTAWQQSR